MNILVFLYQYKRILIWILCIATATSFFIFLHRNPITFSYYGEIWADRSGYYVYLPFVFNYKAKANLMPQGIDIQTGQGFEFKNNRMITKYSCGTALMQLPFYGIAELMYYIKPKGTKGFSLYHHKMVAFAGLVYVVIGFAFLYSFLRYYYSEKIVFWVLISLFWGTNILYYAEREGGMSHIYSFCLFSMYMYSLKKTDFFRNKLTLLESLGIGCLVGMMILIRPTNLIFLVFGLFLDAPSEIKNRIKAIFTQKYWIVMILAAILIHLPQMIYWKYAYNNFIQYSYGNEGFTNWNKPPIIKFLFAPNNGLFVYNPLALVMLMGGVLMIYHKIANGYWVMLLFTAVTYIFASWWVYHFGCSYGSRNFVEYYAGLSLGLGYAYTRISTLRSYQKYSIAFLIFVLVALNFKLFRSFDGCFYYNGDDWNWQEWIKILLV